MEGILSWLKKHKNKVIILSAAALVLNFLIWAQIFTDHLVIPDLKIYFLDVGQGDSGFVELPGFDSAPFGSGIQILIDGGPPNGKALNELGRILKLGDRYIDLVVLTHPQLDHFGGLIEVLKRYKVGALIWNGLEGKSTAFQDFKKAVRESGAQEIILMAGDRIRYGRNEILVLSPDENFLHAQNLNDTSLVLELRSKNSKTLFTGDISFKVETNLLTSNVDILKVAHHGSRFSSAASFLEAVKPKVAVIGVGKNSYGHPTAQVLERLANAGAQIFRTDLDGTVKLVIDGENIKVFKNRSNAIR